MPVMAGWLTGEQVQPEVIEQALTAMSTVLGRHGGTPARIVQPGAGLITFSDMAYAPRRNTDPPALDWVPDRRTFVYRRPLAGSHALYYIEDWPAQGNLLFASEIKALFAVGVSRQLHLAALGALMDYGFIPAPWTAFKDIQVVPAGSILRWQHAKTVLGQATDYHFAVSTSSPPTLDQLHTQLQEASADQSPLHEQSNCVALASGGTASTLATLLVAEQNTQPFTVSTIGDYTKSDQEEQWVGVEELAEKVGQPFLAITGVDQPQFWEATIACLEAPAIDTRPLALHQLLHTISVETGARVAISGLGAGILIGSGLQGQSAQAASKPIDCLQAYRSMLRKQTSKIIWSQDVRKVLQESHPWEETLHARKLARRAAQFEDPDQGRYYLDLHLRLPDLIVHSTQQLATQERIVLRSPYLDPRVLESLTRWPNMSESLSVEDGTKADCLAMLLGRYMPGRVMDTLTNFPLAIPGNSLRDVAGSSLLRELLSPEALRAVGVFDPDAVEELLLQDTSRELLLVFTTQLLCQLFQVDAISS